MSLNTPAKPLQVIVQKEKTTITVTTQEVVKPTPNTVIDLAKQPTVKEHFNSFIKLYLDYFKSYDNEPWGAKLFLPLPNIWSVVVQAILVPAKNQQSSSDLVSKVCELIYFQCNTENRSNYESGIYLIGRFP